MVDEPPVPLDPEFESRLSTQSYGAGESIVGVEIHDLRRFVEAGGSFVELGRLEAGALRARPGFRLRQINHVLMEPGTIKAFHLHLRQSEIWFATPDSRLLVGLLDARHDSASRRASMRLVLGDGQSRLLYIPAGVAHGVRALGSRPASLIYLTDREFDPDPARCDEKRLPWDLLGAEFWEPERG